MALNCPLVLVTYSIKPLGWVFHLLDCSLVNQQLHLHLQRFLLLVAEFGSRALQWQLLYGVWLHSLHHFQNVKSTGMTIQFSTYRWMCLLTGPSLISVWDQGKLMILSQGSNHAHLPSRPCWPFRPVKLFCPWHTWTMTPLHSHISSCLVHTDK